MVDVDGMDSEKVEREVSEIRGAERVFSVWRVKSLLFELLNCFREPFATRCRTIIYLDKMIPVGEY